MGRPPAAADADCTVPYHAAAATDSASDGRERYDVLNASVQILTLVERIIREVYSRRRISPQLTEGLSRQLREWSGRWLPGLLMRVNSAAAASATATSATSTTTTTGDEDDNDDDDEGNRAARESMGACQVLSSYYYAVMLVSRPFLMYELCRRLPENGNSGNHNNGSSNSNENSNTTRHLLARENGGSGRAKLANACIDAATLLIGLISDLVEQGLPDRRMPLMV